MKILRQSSRLISFLLILVAFIVFFRTNVCAEGFLNYYFTPDTKASKYDDESYLIKDFIEDLPQEIKNELPGDIENDGIETITNEAEKLTDFSNMWNKIFGFFVDSLFPALKTVSVILGIVIIAAVIRLLKIKLYSGGVSELSDTVINMGMGIILIGTQISVINVLQQFKETICGLMNSMIPLIGGILAASGNGGTAAIQSGGLLMLVTLCQNIFSGILLPSVRITLAFGIIGAVFPELGVNSLTKIFKNISITVMATVMTLFSFLLSLQSSVAQSADTFTTRTIKFALGNFVPIIGGPVSDSLGTIGGSLGLLKSAGGNIAIAVIIIIIAPILLTLICNSLALFICKMVAGALECKNEESLMGEMISVSSMMIAFVISISIAFLFALTLFTKASLAISS